MADEHFSGSVFLIRKTSEMWHKLSLKLCLIDATRKSSANAIEWLSENLDHSQAGHAEGLASDSSQRSHCLTGQ